MLILALDAALAACSAATFDSGRGRLIARAWEAMERGQAERLAGMARDVTVGAGLDLARIGRIAVTVGPGTFTGVRIGLAMARGLRLALGIPAVGLTTLEAIRLNLDGDLDHRPLACLIDARRGEFYLAVWSADGALVVPPRAIRHGEAADVVPDESLLIGPGADRLMDLAGPRRGYRRVAALDLPDAARMAERAASLDPGEGPPEPLYLRPASATRPAVAAADDLFVAEATAAHAPVLAALHAQCFERGWPAADMARLMAMPGAISLIASQGDHPAGFVVARRAADEAEIITIGTAPGARRRGIARRLIDRLVALQAQAGVSSLIVDVAAGNAAARSLYAKLGFVVAGLRPAYYSAADGRREDALIMRLAL